MNLINDIINNKTDLNNFDDLIVSDECENNAYEIWTGKVVKNDDPMKLGRIKIRIFGYYDDLDVANIPWALPENNYVGSTRGTLIIPELGTLVKGYFDKNDEIKPIYNGLAFNADNIRSSPAREDIERDYPNLMVIFHTDQGELITLNKNDGELKIIHRSGSYIEINKTGTITITTNTNLDNESGHVNLNIAGNIDVHSINGKINVIADKGDINVDSTAGNVNLGKNAAKQLVNNLPNCLVTGAPHCLGNINVKV